MDKKVFDSKGKEVGTFSLRDDVFNVKVSQGSIYEAVKNELANLRQGTAAVKNRAKVKGSNRKPWAQKGSGNARVGDKKSPLWRSGGVIFGPQPRDYSYSLPKKVKRLALRSVLSLKAASDESFRLLKPIQVESGKTRDLLEVLKINGLKDKQRSILVYSGEDQKLKRAGRNIPNLIMLNSDRLRVHDLFYGKFVWVTEDAALRLNELYGEKS